MVDKSFQLYDSVISEHTITCDNCGADNSVGGGDDVDACEYFYEEGWRSRSKTYCPKCAKKKLKNPNK